MKQQRIRSVICEQEVTVVCKPSQANMARDLLIMLGSISRNRELRAGMRVRYGWSVLILRENSTGGLIVCEPDFEGDPIHGSRPEVDTTLEVIERQTAVTERCGVTPVDVGFEQVMVVGRKALAESCVQLYRATPSDAADSGWSIQIEGAAPSDESGDFSAIRVFELLSVRPSLLAVLALPLGFAVVFQGDRLMAVFDPEGKELLQRSPGS